MPIRLIALLISFASLALSARAQANDLKVYVMIGFHVDFYHSWRGDSPDDAGYGYDVKIIRSTIDKLNAATRKGQKAKVYWDFAANHWTFGEFVPKHFPDVIPLLQSRDGIDEFIAGPFNNGMGAATNKREFLKSVEWTLENPAGYGLKQLFKNVGMSYRPQEMSQASFQNRWLKEAGIQNLILYYAACAFDGFAPFVSPLSWEERLNPLWMKTHEDDEPIVLLPAMSPIDLVNYVSLENLMVEMRKKQLSGEIKRNVVIHLNMDADAQSWEPVVPNAWLQKIVPNTGGLQEMIDAVNKYAWADFTTPNEYLRIEKPQRTIFIRQDTADGSFTGLTTWAEKENTGRVFPRIERSRSIDRLLEARGVTRARTDWDDKGFVDRLLALSTTHYGMATPFVHRERVMRLETYTNESLTNRNQALSSWLSQVKPKDGFSFFEYPKLGETKSSAVKGLQHQTFTVSAGVKGGPSGLDFIRRKLDDETDLIETFRESTGADAFAPWANDRATECSPDSEPTLTGSDGLKVTFSPIHGISSLSLSNEIYGAEKFLSPFVSWKERASFQKGARASALAFQIRPSRYQISSQSCVSAPAIKETLLKSSFRLKGPTFDKQIDANYRFWTDKNLPYVFVDVSAFIPVTADETATDPVDRRYMSQVDFRLQELALAQLKPSLGTGDPFRIWKMNFEGDVSHYDVDYEKFNAKNLNLDAINNHATPGWIAVSNGKKGVLIAFQTSKRASFGAVPMRLRSERGQREIYLNPFGTYFGKQFNYEHVGGEKLGTILANLGGVFIRSNAPSYSGKNIDFELMIAPYKGGEPTKELIKAALSFAYPAISFAKHGEYLQDDFEGAKKSFFLQTQAREKELFGKTVTTPVGLAATALDGGLRVMWQSTHPSTTAEYEVSYRKKAYLGKWKTERTRETSLTLDKLTNDRPYEVKVRAIGQSGAGTTAITSPFTKVQVVTPSDLVKDKFVNDIAPTPNLVWMFMTSIWKHNKLKDPAAPAQ